ncbi:MAG: MBL fold metallo-hydrolase [Candidatus Methylomirabilales bacterium]
MAANERGEPVGRGAVREGGVELIVLGAGDAFGSGGRNQPAFLVHLSSWAFLLDCGATTLMALKRLDLDPEAIGAILISHLHGDHTAGIPFLFLQYQFLSRRQAPLVIAGPPGIEERVEGLWGLMYKETQQMVERRFPVQYLELEPKSWTRIGPLEVFPLEVVHLHREVAYGYKVKTGGKVLGYSGDTEWTDNLIALSEGCDLFICESYRYDRTVRFHMSYQDIQTHRSALNCKRLLLTHLHTDALARAADIPDEVAYDGMRLFL